jgi:hypothetical protein
VIKYLTDAMKGSSDSNPQYFVTGWVEAKDVEPVAQELGEAGKFVVVKPYLSD